MDGLKAQWNYNPFDEENQKIVLSSIFFFVAFSFTTWLTKRFYKLSDEDFSKEMEKYAEEGRIYADEHWGEFKNRKKNQGQTHG